MYLSINQKTHELLIYVHITTKSSSNAGIPSYPQDQSSLLRSRKGIFRQAADKKPKIPF